MRSLAVTCVAALLAVTAAAGQTTVLSVIRPNRSADGGGSLGVPLNGRFVARNVTAQDLIAAAYGGLLPLDAGHIKGMPPWARRDRFDVEARADDAAPTEDSEDDSAIYSAFSMVRMLLRERFALQVHESTQQEPVYALVRAGRRRGTITPTSRDCAAIAKAGPFGELRDASGQPMGPCGIRVRPGALVASGATLAQLAQRLSPVQGISRVVTDRTRLEGRFDFTLEWAPPQAPRNDAGVAPVLEAGPSIFTALQEQLGLKLESTRGPVRVLVVDHVDRPTPN